ncbi:unnamed protein product [Durusdinium trenchii]|uniref:Uncharacterized protein n=1 Tax=Durusdinium trenchii TaxID=1381693 RepID=A0ABP0HHQ6_9DINO
MKLEECKEAEPEKAVPEVAEGEKDGKEGNKKNQEEPEEARSQRRLLVVGREEENIDYLKELEEELEQAEYDVFEVEDDWALLSLRFELHLLAHAFLHDCGDPERSGIYPDHLLFYYSRYFKKGLNPKNYGVDNVEELVGLVRDAVVLMCPPKVLESTLAAELEGNVEG